MLSALAYCHDTHGVGHGEIRPENLILCKNQNIVLCDFQTSKIFKLNTDKSNKLLGSIRF